MGSKKKGKKAPERFHFFPQEGVSHEGRTGTMTLADDMRNLCQVIPASFDARVARVKALKDETAELLKGFQQDLRQKATDLQRFLSDAEDSRKREFRAMHEGIRARQEERNRETARMMEGFHRGSQQRSREVGDMLAGFRREQQAMAGHWRNMAATMASKRAGGR